jgi:hypothetical protein
MSTPPHDHPIPYPQSGVPHEGGELVLTYSLREVIDQMNRKLDVLPTIAHQTEQNAAANIRMQAEVASLSVRMAAVELVQNSSNTVSLFKDKVWQKLLGTASIVGVVSGVVIAVINILI